MRSTRTASLRGAVFSAIALLFTASCAEDSIDDSDIVERGQSTFDERGQSTFEEIIAKSYHPDYQPLSAPSEAMAVADFAFTAQPLSAKPGMSFSSTKPQEDEQYPSFITLVVTVEDVLKGDITSGEDVPLQITVGEATSSAELSANLPLGPILVMATDETGWLPDESVTREWPDEIGQTPTSIIVPLPDGIWYVSQEELTSLHRPVGDLAPVWGHPETVADLKSTLSRASN